jgi:hypothetical protein
MDKKKTSRTATGLNLDRPKLIAAKKKAADTMPRTFGDYAAAEKVNKLRAEQQSLAGRVVTARKAGARDARMRSAAAAKKKP